MLIIEVKLLSAITHKETTLARMEVYNDGTGTATRGNYVVTTMRGRDAEELSERKIQRRGKVLNYPRKSLHVWNLVARALEVAGYK